MKFNWVLLVSVALSHVAFAEQHVPGANAGRRAKERREAKIHTVDIGTRKAISVFEGCLDEKRQDLVSRLNSGKEVGFNELTDALIARHQAVGSSVDASRNVSDQALDLFLGKIRTGVSNEDLHQMKVDVDSLISKSLGKLPVYNARSNSLSDLCSNGSCSAYSGTVLNQVIARKVLSKQLFEAKNPVVIYQNGNMLPGYVVETPQGKRLIGIETTSAGQSKIDFGLTTDISPEEGIKVVKANDWLLMEVFQDCLKDREALGNEMLAEASQAFDLEHVKSQFKVDAKVVLPLTLPPTSPGNSVFSMGEKALDVGDVARVHIDSKLRSAGPSKNTNETEIRGQGIILQKAGADALKVASDATSAFHKKFSAFNQRVKAKRQFEAASAQVVDALSKTAIVLGDKWAPVERSMRRIQLRKSLESLSPLNAPVAVAPVVKETAPIVPVSLPEAVTPSIEQPIAVEFAPEPTSPEAPALPENVQP